tara:strand:+ start:155 stop:364 length:210 start_codon:yes stop_codon:yes gene_type:complete
MHPMDVAWSILKYSPDQEGKCPDCGRPSSNDPKNPLGLCEPCLENDRGIMEGEQQEQQNDGQLSQRFES